MKIIKHLIEWYVNYPHQLSIELPLEHDEKWIDNFVNNTLKKSNLDYKEVEAYNGRQTRFVIIGFTNPEDAHSAAEDIQQAISKEDISFVGLGIASAGPDTKPPRSSL